MPIESLSIRRFRNLQPTELRLSPHLNVITGDNAAGKTSILEALYVLARGRSFRTTRLNQLVQTGQTDFQLVARLVSGSGRIVPVGLQRSEGRLTCRVDGRTVRKLSELAALFPVHWVGGNLHKLVEDGPAYRRQFLDWGLFHVKPDYMALWKRFHKLLKQRNAVLRSGGDVREVKAWHPELAETAELLHQSRQTYLNQLAGVFAEITPQFSALSDGIHLTYQRGWSEGGRFIDTLTESLEKDRERGFTSSGPQRAELAFSIGHRPAGEQLSRGQQKLFITALQVAQARLLQHQTGRSSLFLLDDLGSELDMANQQATLRLLADIEAQVVVTSIETPPIAQREIPGSRRFHVEHGLVTEVV